MGLNRMMMKNGEDLKNIKAMMTVGGGKTLHGTFEMEVMVAFLQTLCLMAF